MRKYDKTLNDVLSGKRDNNIKFNDLCKMLESLGIELQRISGSHHVFAYPGIVESTSLEMYTPDVAIRIKYTMIANKILTIAPAAHIAILFGILDFENDLSSSDTSSSPSILTYPP